MLAVCITAQLWHNTMADQQALAKHIICITFGQPLMQLKMVEEEIGFSPQFEKSIHCILYKDDLFPVVLGYLPTNEGAPVPNLSPQFNPKTKALPLATPSDTVSPANTQTATEQVWVEVMYFTLI